MVAFPTLALSKSGHRVKENILLSDSFAPPPRAIKRITEKRKIFKGKIDVHACLRICAAIILAAIVNCARY